MTYTRSRGFTLVETAIVLLILGLVLGGGLTLLGAQVEQQRIRDTQRILDEAREALIGYALNQTPAHLPCPDKTGGGGAGTANDGLEDFSVTTGQCVTQEGNVPWATLGVADIDAWGNRIHYSVTAVYSNRTPTPPAPLAVLSLTSTGALRVCRAAGCAVVTANQVPAVVLSYGPNGFGAINAAGNTTPAPVSADELENTNLNPDFVARPPSASGAMAGEFDDTVTWLSANVLFNRLVQAGRLP